MTGLTAFAHYNRLLGSAGANIGECATLAFAETASAVAVLDDQAAVNAGVARGVKVRRTLALLCEGIRHAVLDATAAAVLVDELRGQGGARLPCTGASFIQWATRQNLL